jgi:FtsH-binding integral membrane protein
MRNFDYTATNYKFNERTNFDGGLREYFLKVYSFMSLGLLITAISAFAVLNIPALTQMMFNTQHGSIGLTGLGQVVSFSPLLMSVYFAYKFNDMTVDSVKLWFGVYAVLMGMSLSSLGLIYTGTSIVRTFFICSSMFGAMSIYGYSTKKDLTAMGSFMFMGLIGILICSVVNIFLQSAALEFALSIIGVVVFTGLIAYDTQKLKALYYAGGNNNEKLGLMGAFTLYLDFINLFVFLLRFMGSKRN